MAQDLIQSSNLVRTALLTNVNNDIAELFTAVGNKAAANHVHDAGDVVFAIGTNADRLLSTPSADTLWFTEDTRKFWFYDQSEASWYNETATSVSSYSADSTEADQGVTGSGITIKAFVDSIGSDSATILLSHNSGSEFTDYVVSTNLNIPENITLKRERGARLQVASGITVTIDGTVEAGWGDFFTGTGVVNITYGQDLLVDWWGIKNDDSTDNAAAFEKLFSSLQANNGGYTIRLRGGVYQTASQIDVYTSGNNLYNIKIVSESGGPLTEGTAGNGDAAIIKYAGVASATSAVVSFEQCGGCYVENVHFDGNALSGYAIRWGGGASPGAPRGWFNRCRAYGATVQNVFINSSVGDTSSQDLMFDNTFFIAEGTCLYNIRVQHTLCDGLRLRNCEFQATSTGVVKNHIFLDTGNNLYAENCRSSGTLLASAATDGHDIYTDNGINGEIRNWKSGTYALLYASGANDSTAPTLILSNCIATGSGRNGNSVYFASTNNKLIVDGGYYKNDISLGALHKHYVHSRGVSFFSGKSFIGSDSVRVYGDLGTQGAWASYDSASGVVVVSSFASTHFLTLTGNVTSISFGEDADNTGDITTIYTYQSDANGYTIDWTGDPLINRLMGEYDLNPQPSSGGTEESIFQFLQNNGVSYCIGIRKGLYDGTAQSSAVDFSVDAGNSGNTYEVDTSSGIVTVSLPVVNAAPDDQYEYSFVREGANALRIDPDVGANNSIKPGGIGKYLSLDTDGGTVTIKSYDGDWHIFGSYGTLSFEA